MQMDPQAAHERFKCAYMGAGDFPEITLSLKGRKKDSCEKGQWEAVIKGKDMSNNPLTPKKMICHSIGN